MRNGTRLRRESNSSPRSADYLGGVHRNASQSESIRVRIPSAALIEPLSHLTIELIETGNDDLIVTDPAECDDEQRRPERGAVEPAQIDRRKRRPTPSRRVCTRTERGSPSIGFMMDELSTRTAKGVSRSGSWFGRGRVERSLGAVSYRFVTVIPVPPDRAKRTETITPPSVNP